MSMEREMQNYSLMLQRTKCVECTATQPCRKHSEQRSVAPEIAQQYGVSAGKAAPLLNKIGVYTAAIIRDMQGRYFIQQNRKRNQWVFPGGKPEPGETSFECLVRECREELGIEITKAKYRETFCTEYEGMEWIGIFYEVQDYTGTIQNLEPHKHAGHMWLPPQFFKDYNLAVPEAGIMQISAKLYADWLAAQ